MSRSLARELALQLLYQLESNPESMQSQIEDFAIERLGEPPTESYLARVRERVPVEPAPIEREATQSPQVYRRMKKDINDETTTAPPTNPASSADHVHDPYLPISEDSDQQKRFRPRDLTYIRDVAAAVHRRRPQLDLLYAPFLKRWTPSRLPQVDRCILRLATYEIYYSEDVPVAVAVNEAVDLARRFAAEDAHRYIHGVLGAMTKAQPTLPEIHESPRTSS